MSAIISFSLTIYCRVIATCRNIKILLAVFFLSCQQYQMKSFETVLKFEMLILYAKDSATLLAFRGSTQSHVGKRITHNHYTFWSRKKGIFFKEGESLLGFLIFPAQNYFIITQDPICFSTIRRTLVEPFIRSFQRTNISQAYYNVFIITWILHQIITYYMKVKLVAG